MNGSPEVNHEEPRDNVTWTAEQQLVIDTRGKDILVSAAAGSGKTAVLVERIITMITEEAMDIDRLLVVTFTNAAAAQMRGRIRDALEKRAEQEPDNEHLQRQLVLVMNAKIMTIHSFCLHVLRNHFQTIGIDPSFRIADEGEVLLLEQETVKEVVDEAYDADSASGKQETSEFSQFLEQFSTGKGDADVEEMILQIYHFALGQPFPEEWLKECRAAYGTPDFRDSLGIPPHETGSRDTWSMQNRCAAGNSPVWISFIEADTAARLGDVKEQLELALRMTQEPDGPYPYEKALRSDLDQVGELLNRKTFAEYLNAFRNMGAMARLGTKKDDRISEEKKQKVASIRSDCKEQIGALRECYYYDEIDVLREDFLKSGVVVRVLTKLTEAFMKRLSEKKAEKNVLDFGDMEHLALNALMERDAESGQLKPSPVALEYAETFQEVMIDEYQDSNLVQELILSSVSGASSNAHNRFMVGDVKQSKYRFRLARPELFMEKYHTYRRMGTKEAESAENTLPGTCRIDLHRNFRSRRQVLDSVNFVFRQIMTEPLGGVAYDDDAALYPGTDFPEPPMPSCADADQTGDSEDGGQRPVPDPYRTELLILDGSAEENGDVSSESLRKDEAKMVGRRILELVGKLPVADKEHGGFRPAGFGDVVILLRAVSGWAETFGEVLADMGIPVFTGSQKGYFSAAEVRTVLSYLQILDNPLQDIPLAAVLRSAIGGFTDEELAKIRLVSGGDSNLSFYDCCRRYLADSASGETDGAPGKSAETSDERTAEKIIAEKLHTFFETYESLRAKCAHTPVHQLIWEMLDVTGYGEYAAALPAGQQRRANLDMLVEKAIAYEATSFRGLYHFVRYIENLQKYEVDYGEASLTGEAGDVVRIMSIHKSKGLEFPVVFGRGMGKAINEADSHSWGVMHPEWGIACDYTMAEGQRDPAPRMRQATLLKKAIQQKLSTENLGEELRVLYVAMTRAKEKLILTGSVKNLEKKQHTWERTAEHISYSRLSGASGYLDWVVPAVLHQGQETLFSVRTSSPAQNEDSAQKVQVKEAVTLRQLLNLDPARCADQWAGEYLEKVFSSVYPYEKNRTIPGKVTVSELKKMSQRMEEDDAQRLYKEETVVPLIPKFMGSRNVPETDPAVCEEAKENAHTLVPSGAERGTAYHTFMENLDFSKKEDLRLQLEELVRCGKMSEDDAASIRLRDISVFLRSDLGRRMERAAQEGQLFREQPFVLGVPASEIYGDSLKGSVPKTGAASENEDASPSGEQPPEEEIVLVQGIIDAFFIEDGGLTIVDYKTDRVADGETLISRYRTQIDYYEKALKRLTGRPVRGRMIYSFHLGKEIRL